MSIVFLGDIDILPCRSHVYSQTNASGYLGGLMKENDSSTQRGRREVLLTVAAGAGLLINEVAGLARTKPSGLLFPPDRSAFGGGGSAGGGVHRSQNDLYDCEVEGSVPSDLDGVFYRVGPDPQYPKSAKYVNDIPFDGEGHVSMFRIKDGHVDYRSRYIHTQRWKAQHAARRSLFGMYRNPWTNDPSVKNISAGTANTQVVYHHQKLFAMKEDSPPVELDPLTLETTNDYYTFRGGMKSLTFTAHPKLDPESGEMIAFGYEAKGFYTPDIEVFSVDRTGKVNWSTWIKSPYTCMIHDFGVTQKHIAFLVTPLAASQQLIDQGGPHWAWDSTLPSYLGVMRRGGDGKDIVWIKGPTWMATHTMGAWTDGDKLFLDMDGAPGNQFAFFPNIHEAFDPKNAAGHVVRIAVDMSKSQPQSYSMETLYPSVTGVLSRQDDRFHTIPYRYGFLHAFTRWVMLDHQKMSTSLFAADPDTSLAEMCFVPRRKGAPEADGYLIGVANRLKENGRSDVIIADAQHLEEGPIATIKMPYRIVGQVHGFWVPGDQLPSVPSATDQRG
jgi:carotenoid cleavage dioxygenase-like enzyme